MNLRSSFRMARLHLLQALDRRVVSLHDGGPFVSFTFDDFPRTACTVGGAILKNYGVRGTYYISMGLINTSNQLGEQFRAEDLWSLAADNHELASHTFNHTSAREVSGDVFRQDVRKGKNALREIEGLNPSENFAYPYGHVTSAARRALAGETASSRGIQGGLNGPLVELDLLRANYLYGDGDQLDSLHQLIRENEQRKAWLIFYTHDVSVAPSPFGCTPKLLESTVRMVLDSGSTILPVAGVLRRVGGERRITADGGSY